MSDPKALTVDELIEHLSAASKAGHGGKRVAVAYDTGIASVGAGPSVGFTGALVGFDWEQGSVFLQSEKPLGLATEELKALGRRADNLAAALYRLEHASKALV